MVLSVSGQSQGYMTTELHVVSILLLIIRLFYEMYLNTTLVYSEKTWSVLKTEREMKI